MNSRKPIIRKPAEKKIEKPSRDSKHSERKESFGKDERPKRKFDREGDADTDKKKTFSRERNLDKPYDKKNSKPSFSRKFDKDDKKEFNASNERKSFGKDKTYKDKTSLNTKKPLGKSSKSKPREDSASRGEGVRLNKYIANAGVCSRRDADVLIQSGNVTINGEIVTEMGVKVYPGDMVNYDGKVLRNERKVYVLLNKPKDYITTSDDPQKRRTVLSLISGACKERIYPVGRLDRMTTGVLLFTNDGDLVKKLTHPKHGVRKIYHVVLDKNFTKPDMVKVIEGVELEDGLVDVDKISYAGDASDKKELGVELHSGKNRIVRRLFENLGYNVVKLDRVSFAGLTKKNLQKGQWRFLTPKEISFLKMLK